MQTGDRAEFDRQFEILFAALDRPVSEARREAFWKGLAKMGLIEFCRCVDLLLSELETADAPRHFGVSEVWAAKRRLRAAPVVYAHQKPDEWRGDAWDVRANRLLLGHIAAQARAGVHYCCEDTRFGRRRASDPSPLTRELTAPLVAYKAAWARDMREIADEHEGGVDPRIQREAWRDCMERATAEIERVRARQPPAQAVA